MLCGNCGADLPACANLVNAAQRRLLMAKEAGQEGWYGTWAEVRWTQLATQPYVTLDRWMARLENVDFCKEPIPVNNQFFEYLDFGAGRQPNRNRIMSNFQTGAYTRNNAVTFRDVTSPPQMIRVASGDARDNGKRVLIQGFDNNGLKVYSMLGVNQVEGESVILAAPFIQSLYQWNQITGIQKDTTFGNIQFYQVDPTTGATVLIHTMEPGETTAWYRRYYFANLPHRPGPFQMSALVKLELVPAVVDTDWLLIQNLEAIIEEAQAVRYSGMDSPNASGKSVEHHITAIRFLQGELNHYLGKDSPAVNIQPFGSAYLEKLNISMR